MISRQALHARAKRAAAGIKPPHRPRWACPVCGAGKRRQTASGERICSTCHPGAGRGRPRKPPVDASPPPA